MQVKLTLAFLFIFLIAVFPLPGQNRGTDTNNGHTVVANQVILKVAAPTSAILQQVQQLGDADDFRPLSRSLNIFLLHSRSGSVAALLNSVKNHPSVLYVEPDYIVKAVVTPNDPYFSQQWSLLNTSTPGADIGATNAWAISTGSGATEGRVRDRHQHLRRQPAGSGHRGTDREL